MKSFHPYRLSLLLLLASFLLYSHSYIVIRSIHSTIIRHRILSLLNSNLDAYVSDDPYISVMIIPTGIGARLVLLTFFVFVFTCVTMTLQETLFSL